MKLSDFILRIKLELPNLGQTSAIDDAFLTTLLNQACNEVNSALQLYKDKTYFNIVANQKNYSLASIVPNFLGRDARGVFFKDSNGDWAKVYPRSENYLSENIVNYLNTSAVPIPQYYCIDGDDFIFEPAADTDQANGGLIFHLKKATPMVNSDDYPFIGTNTGEISALLPADGPIISFCKWKIATAYGTVTDIDLKEREFSKALISASRFIKNSPDIMGSNHNRIRI